MNINIDLLVKHMNACETIDSALATELVEVMNSNNFFSIYSFIKKLKNEVVKVQQYEIASYIRDLEKTFCSKYFDADTAKLVYDNKLTSLFINVKDEKSVKIYEDLFNNKISDEIKLLYSDVVISIIDGSILLGIKEGKLIYSSNLNISKLSDLVKK